jgi:branched-chain amino acid transport system ATP-binding protein
MAELLTVRGLTLSFGGLHALDDVDLDIPEGVISGLIGPNGAGKTSMLNCICRFYRPQQGRIRLGGEDLLRHPPHHLARLGVARTFQQMELFAMTLLDNVLVGAHTASGPGPLGEAFGLPSARRAAARQRALALETLDLVGLRHLAGVSVRALPLGLQKRAGIARALACRPRLLLLDEPAGGLNTTEKRELGTLVRTVRDRLGLTVLLIEHDMDLVMSLCEHIAVLDFGKRIAAGPPDVIQRDPAVIEAYLGVAPPEGEGGTAGAHSGGETLMEAVQP